MILSCNRTVEYNLSYKLRDTYVTVPCISQYKTICQSLLLSRKTKSGDGDCMGSGTRNGWLEESDKDHPSTNLSRSTLHLPTIFAVSHACWCQQRCADMYKSCSTRIHIPSRHLQQLARLCCPCMGFPQAVDLMCKQQPHLQF